MRQRDDDGLIKGAGLRADRRRRRAPAFGKAQKAHDETKVWVVGSNEPEPAPTVPAKPVELGENRDRSLTQVYRPGGKTSAATDAMSDPPAGWLVIVDGPGKGHVVQLGYGLNWIGRDPTERLTLDYGDAAISRQRHVAVVYDASSRKFHIQHGGGVNLSYLNDQPVLAPAELSPFAHIRIGNTTLRFVPLCGPDFSWEEHGSKD